MDPPLIHLVLTTKDFKRTIKWDYDIMISIHMYMVWLWSSRNEFIALLKGSQDVWS